MKRSEMIQKIQWLIDDSVDGSEHLAFLILDTIEENGMKPPLGKVTIEEISIPTSDGPPTRHDIKTQSHEWDAE